MSNQTVSQHMDSVADRVARVRRFWAGEGRCLASITSQHEIYRQMDDLDEMARKAVLNLEHQATLPGANVPSLIADFGTVSTARYWGGQAYRDSTGENLHIRPAAQTIEEALACQPLPVDHSDMDAARALRFFDMVRERLGNEELWLRPADLQGALNTAGLIMNQENLFMAMFSDGDEVHHLLDRVCDFLIEFVRYTREATGNQVAGSIWPYIFLPPDLGFGVTEDLMPLLSDDLYRDFGIPYMTRMTEQLGPAHIHCCGAYGHQVRNLADSDVAIRSIEFFYPFTRVEQLGPLVEQGVVLVPFIFLDKCDEEFDSDIDYYRHLLATTGDEHRYWFALLDDSGPTQDFVREVTMQYSP